MKLPPPDKPEPKPWPLTWIFWLILAYILFQSLYAWWHWDEQL